MSNIGFLDQSISIALVRFNTCFSLSEIGELTATKVVLRMLIDVRLIKNTFMFIWDPISARLEKLVMVGSTSKNAIF